MLPSVRAVVPGITLPPVEDVYQVILDPVTLISDITGFVLLQKVCVASPAGAEGVVFTDIATASLDVDSHPFMF